MTGTSIQKASERNTYWKTLAGLKKSVPSYQAYSDIQPKMRGRQVEMRADILDKNGQWPRLRGGNAKPDPNLPVPAIPLFLPDVRFP